MSCNLLFLSQFLIINCWLFQDQGQWLQGIAMNQINRRQCVAGTVASLASAATALRFENALIDERSSLSIQHGFRPPAFSITPVVSDGEWIWGEPPNEKGYLEPREFELSIGMKFTGTGKSSGLSATTVAPVSFPEQEITDFRLETENCRAEVVPITDGAAQLAMSADSLSTGVTASATAHYRLKIFKSYMGFEQEQFPLLQPRLEQAPKQFLKNSPGIKATATSVKEVVGQVASSEMHPWKKAFKFDEWVWENIAGVPGKYTSVEEAIRNRKGDCEERACTFIALCRAAGIPARQVWIPNHAWAEIALHDHDGIWHWIPVHTAAYSWFGWTGVHEIILQKGDRIYMPSRRRNLRLVDDWYRLQGPRPTMQFTANLKPVAEGSGDAGPGSRKKIASGKWELTGNHTANRFMRDR